MRNRHLRSMLVSTALAIFAAGSAYAVPAGYVSGLDLRGAKCMDRIVKTTYFDWSVGKGDWDCTDGGMPHRPGTFYFIKIIGVVNDERPIGVNVTSGDQVAAIGCNNLDTGMRFFYFLEPEENGFFDCARGGDMGDPGDRFLIQVRGNEATP